MRKCIFQLVVGLILVSIGGRAEATLSNIGYAVIDGQEYNLIWDDDNNGNSLVWLDYTNGSDTWGNQMAWAASLNETITVNLYDGYTVDWGDSDWRLASTGTDPDPGYNQNISELGHLYYDELGLDQVGTYSTDELNAGIFDSLSASYYWTETTASDPYSWAFCMADGWQARLATDIEVSGIAVHNAQVSVAPVPEPATFLLLGSGLLGIVGFRTRSKKI